MLKWFLPFFAVGLVAITAAPLISGAQQGSPAPAMTPPETASPTPQAGARNPVKPTAESQARAKAIYQLDCSMCHGDNGNGQTDLAKSMQMTLDDWTNPATLAGKTDSELFNIIRNGKDKMPPEDVGRANDTQVWNLIIYIRTFSKGQPSAPAPAPSPAP